MVDAQEYPIDGLFISHGKGTCTCPLLAFTQSRFAEVYYKFEELNDENKQSVIYLLDILEREIERLRKKERSQAKKR